MDTNKWETTRLYKETMNNVRALAGFLGEKHCKLIDRLIREEAKKKSVRLPNK
jgi:hypothetical protein